MNSHDFYLHHIPETNLIVDGFKHRDPLYSDRKNIYILTHFHSDHYAGIIKRWKFGNIYCSETTYNLLKWKFNLGDDVLVPVKDGQIISFPQWNYAFQLIDANHCPGSRMVIIWQGEKIYLHTGDCRFHAPEILKEKSLHPFVKPEFQKILDEINKIESNTTENEDKEFEIISDELDDILEQIEVERLKNIEPNSSDQSFGQSNQIEISGYSVDSNELFFGHLNHQIYIKENSELNVLKNIKDINDIKDDIDDEDFDFIEGDNCDKVNISNNSELKELSFDLNESQKEMLDLSVDTQNSLLNNTQTEEDESPITENSNSILDPPHVILTFEEFTKDKTELTFDKIYLDTTYCNPKDIFPSQFYAMDFISNIIAKKLAIANSIGKKIQVIVGSYTIGKERIVKAIADRCGCKIYTKFTKYKILELLNLPYMDLFVTNSNLTPLHFVDMGDLNWKRIREIMSINNHIDEFIVIKPSAMMREAHPPPPGHAKVSKSKKLTTILVPYSEHSSFHELKNFVNCFRYKEIVPTVYSNMDHYRAQLSYLHSELLMPELGPIPIPKNLFPPNDNDVEKKGTLFKYMKSNNKKKSYISKSTKTLEIIKNSTQFEINKETIIDLTIQDQNEIKHIKKRKKLNILNIRKRKKLNEEKNSTKQTTLNSFFKS